MSTKAAVILAAGKGVRMRSGLSKVLHKICGKELVRHVVDAAKEAGYDRVVVIVSPTNHAPVHDLLGDSVEYAVQVEMLGTGHAVLQAKDLLRDVETVAVLNGDVPLIRPETLRSLLERHESQGGPRHVFDCPLRYTRSGTKWSATPMARYYKS